MLTIVLIINAVLALLCLIVAWQAWKLKGTLGQLADTLTALESTAHQVLYDAPDIIGTGDQGVQLLQERVRQVSPQLQRLRQLLRLMHWGRRLWRQANPRTSALPRRLR